MKDTFSKPLHPDEMNYLFNNDRLGKFYIRKDNYQARSDIERIVSLHDFWKTILEVKEIQPLISPESIHSVILFGSVAEKPPYEIHIGAKKDFHIGKWVLYKWKESDWRQYIPINDVDICVLCDEETKETKVATTFGDLPYPYFGKREGEFHIFYVKPDDYLRFVNEEKHFALQVHKSGINLIDDGTFNEIASLNSETRNPQYYPEWYTEDRYTSPGILGFPEVMKKDVLYGNLVFKGSIPEIKPEE